MGIVPTAKYHYLHLAELYFSKIVAAILGLQGAFGLYNSFDFMFVKIPAMEAQLSQGLVTQADINSLVNYIIISLISTFLSFFFALRINALQTRSARFISALLGAGLIFGNTQLESILSHLRLTDLWLK